MDSAAPTEGGPPDDGPPDGAGDPSDDGSNDDEDIYRDLFSETCDSDYADLPPESRVLLQLSQAISRLSTSNRSSDNSGKTKVRKPDTFDGTDPHKLHAFLVQCELNFQSHPPAFRDDHNKVTFTQSLMPSNSADFEA
ncbi:hypothetical protein K503DRAFT_805147 [Rhizopogon vinicolor AM-OR11-026]|uniref:Uncharacterized protein n=1 Tax=Rhizopogon vinicolor AM-OR11-026 TaxID=1314800 RepID=A0A1B7MIV9_9AGAM|nr:hypothetical protein K503DRAFT_805147 [Rhizopogon vinicolor AM-OR11-026]